MNEPAALTSPLKPRRWKLWVAVSSLLVVGSCVIWQANTESAVLRKSRQIRLGQSMAEVEQLMGPPASKGVTVGPGSSPVVVSLGYATTSESMGMFARYCFNRLLSQVGLGDLTRWPGTPVEVLFDDWGRVSSIRRGTAIERPPQK